jgi:DNA-binding response OmpR family regulator
MKPRSLVLVLEDDPGMLGAVGRVLKLHGYDVEGFGSVQDFVTYASVRNARCLVLDIHLKDGSGLELHGSLVRSGFSPPVIFMTGRDSPATRKSALEAGCLAYLPKPFESSELVAAIEAIAPPL